MIDLKAFRKFYNLTQRVVSEKSGIPQATIAGIETGRSNMSEDIESKIVNSFPEIDFSLFKDEPRVLSSSKQINADTILKMYMEKDKQLIECKDENARLLREIIDLKDRINQERDQSKSAPKTPSKHS